MDIKQFVLDRQKTFATGGNDVVQDGTLMRDVPAPSVLVSAESDLAELPECYPAGTVAYTAGFGGMWQLNAAGEWISMM